MKKQLIICALCAVAVLVQSCGSSSKNLETYTKDMGLTILVDATDTTVYNSIYQDFNTNLDAFFKRTGLANIGKGELLTVKIAPIDASGELTLNQVSIGIPIGVDMSGREMEAACDPQTILHMLVSEFQHYEVLAKNQEQRQSPIIDVLLKACCEMNSVDNEIFLVFSDGLENSAYLNMYKGSIPTAEEQVAAVIDNVDQVLLQDAKKKIAEYSPQMVFVLKSVAPNKCQVKQFYSELCKQLGVSHVQFVDNMSNKISLQK